MPGIHRCQQCVYVQIVMGQPVVGTRTRRGEFFQPLFVQLVDYDFTVSILHETTSGLGNRAALLGANPQCTDTNPCWQGIQYIVQGFFADPVGQKQQIPRRRSRLPEQFNPTLQCQIRPTALAWHDLRAQTVHQGSDSGIVVGERGYNEGLRSIDNQRCLTFIAPLENVPQLEPCFRQTAWLYVGAVHRVGEIQ